MNTAAREGAFKASPAPAPSALEDAEGEVSRAAEAGATGQPDAGAKAKGSGQHWLRRKGKSHKQEMTQPAGNGGDAGGEAVPPTDALAQEIGLDTVEGATDNLMKLDEDVKRNSIAARSKASLGYFISQQDWENKHPEDRDRWWELQLSIRRFQNVTNNTLTFFMCVSVLSEDPKKHISKVRLATRYTPIYTLARGQEVVPINPILLYERTNFSLSYRELERHVVKVDMWQVSCWTFNEYFGYKKELLSDISNRDPNMDLMMKKKISRKQMEGKRKQSGGVGDVALFSCRISLEEIFDFKLNCDNWTLELSKDHPDYQKIQQRRKRLVFNMPKTRKSLPGQRNMSIGDSSTTTTFWNKEASKYFWANCGTFTFRGTRTHLQNSYFVVCVHTGDPPQVLLESDTAQALAPFRTLGRCLMNLTSVLDISVFKGQVKAFEQERRRYEMGVLSGNVKCILCSRGIPKEETDHRGRRPEQPKGSTTVSHLNKDERHLVVKIRKCESLPVADFGSGSSDPYLRVSWDNMVMESQVIKESLRPVFNQSFYFPVRIVFPQMRKAINEIKYEETILRYELETKGAIKIEVWDDDVTSADFLGGCRFTIQDILAVRSTERRNLLGPTRGPEADDEAEEGEVKKGTAWYEAEEVVRLYDGSKTTLIQSSLHNNENALIHFEAYFYPDWSPNLRLGLFLKEEDHGIQWKSREKEWEVANEKFQQYYAESFADSIGAKKCKEESGKNEQIRYFPCLGGQRGKLGELPLMSFLSTIIIPQEYGMPAKLLHWVYCLSFHIATKQLRTGQVPRDGWNDPEYILSRRKGAAQDHAILLCSLLLGCKRDAYVCKGMVKVPEENNGLSPDALVEHVWVMTRDQGWVTFWEPCTRQMFHLPQRYTPTTQRRRKTKRKKGNHAINGNAPEQEEYEKDDGAAGAEEEFLEDDEVARLSAWEGEVADARISIEDMEQLPTVGRQPKAKARSMKSKKDAESRDDLRRKLVANRESLEIAPKRELVREETLVTWLPYDSIDVVFNAKNLWVNRGNHHPACVSYDLADAPAEKDAEKDWKGQWEPFIQDDNCTVTPIAPNVSVLPKLRQNLVESLQSDLRTEMIQNLLLYRGKRGYDTFFDHGEELMLQLRNFLEIQEMWLHVDPDCPQATALLKEIDDDLSPERRFIKETLGLQQWNKRGSPYFQDDVKTNAPYISDQDDLWQQLEAKVAGFHRKLETFPAKRGKRFSGFPVHFSTSEHELIRTYLMEMPKYRDFIDKKEEDLFYSIECFIFPLLGGVLSVWLYIGIQDPLKDEEPEALR